jgi:hypothetical protein
MVLGNSCVNIKAALAEMLKQFVIRNFLKKLTARRRGRCATVESRAKGLADLLRTFCLYVKLDQV